MVLSDHKGLSPDPAPPQATGQYYFQSSDGETLTVVDADGPVAGVEGEEAALLEAQGMEDIIGKGEQGLPSNQVIPITLLHSYPLALLCSQPPAHLPSRPLPL